MKGRFEEFAELVARSGRVYAHPDTVSMIRSKLGTEVRGPLDFATGIEMIEVSTIEVGVLLAFEPQSPLRIL